MMTTMLLLSLLLVLHHHMLAHMNHKRGFIVAVQNAPLRLEHRYYNASCVFHKASPSLPETLFSHLTTLAVTKM